LCCSSDGPGHPIRHANVVDVVDVVGVVGGGVR